MHVGLFKKIIFCPYLPFYRPSLLILETLNTNSHLIERSNFILSLIIFFSITDCLTICLLGTKHCIVVREAWLRAIGNVWWDGEGCWIIRPASRLKGWCWKHLKYLMSRNGLNKFWRFEHYKLITYLKKFLIF